MLDPMPVETRNDVISLPLYGLAREINRAHQEVQLHGKGMLLEAKAAGNALLKAKEEVPHGQFRQWIEANTNVPYRTARRYMQAAKMVVNDHFDPDATIDSILDTNAGRRKAKEAAKTKLPAFDKDDAEHARKLHAMATRGTEHEAAVASTKLENFAQQFGMTAGEVMAKAEEVSPEVTWQEETVRRYIARKFGKKSKHELMDTIMYCIRKHPDLIDDFKNID